MSEVVGYMLVFGILSMLLVLSMLAFNSAQELARARVVEVRAESAAARVAGVVVQTALLAEQESASSPVVAHGVDLPDQLEGFDYTVHLEPVGQPTACGDLGDVATADQVCITVPAVRIGPDGHGVTAPLFSAGASTVPLCSVTVDGGALVVRYGNSANSNKPTCSGVAATSEIFLEAT